MTYKVNSKNLKAALLHFAQLQYKIYFAIKYIILFVLFQRLNAFLWVDLKLGTCIQCYFRAFKLFLNQLMGCLNWGTKHHVSSKCKRSCGRRPSSAMISDIYFSFNALKAVNRWAVNGYCTNKILSHWRLGKLSVDARNFMRKKLHFPSRECSQNEWQKYYWIQGCLFL